MTADLKPSRDFPWIALHNLFTCYTIATDYGDQNQADCRRTDRYVKDLLRRLLKGFSSASSILEVGCGTGYFIHWFDKQGLRSVGLDLSWPMLERAKHLKRSSTLQGDALRLPFASASFDLVALISMLECLPDPNQALNEAIRTARQGLILVMLNARNCLGRGCRRQDALSWDVAHLFTPDEFRLLLRETVGKKPKILWQTSRPFWSESSPYIWGDFFGVAVKLS